MLHDLDTTLSELLKRELPASLAQQVAISFAAPDNTFPPVSVPLPAINLFLYELRENSELRETEPLLERKIDGRVVRTPAPVRLDCHYLVTVWAKGPQPEQDEHRILGETLRVLLRHRDIPAEARRGSMVSQTSPLQATILPANQQMRGDFWQALGGKPKAAFNYTVTISVELGEPEDAGPVVQRALA